MLLNRLSMLWFIINYLNYIIGVWFKGCMPNEVRIHELCYPKKNPGQTCIYSTQCYPRSFSCIKSRCQQRSQPIAKSQPTFASFSSSVNYPSVGFLPSIGLLPTQDFVPALGQFGFTGTSIEQYSIANAGCTSESCPMNGCSFDACSCQSPTFDYICCLRPLSQRSLNFGLLGWTIAISFIPLNSCMTNSNGYCYCTSVKIVTSVIQVAVSTTTPSTTTTTARTTTSSTTTTASSTTSSTTTTTTTSSTTTLPAGTCPPGGCSEDQIMLVNGPNGQPGDIPRPGACMYVNGVLQYTITCMSENGAVVLMTWNNGQGGPTFGNTDSVSATFFCDNGVWRYSEMGVVSDPITSVECLQA